MRILQVVPRDWPVPSAERAKVRTKVAREFFYAEHGREPADARELAATIAKHTRGGHHNRLGGLHREP